MAWIAIDAGTSVIKAVAFSDTGVELALARESTVVLHPKPGYSEQDMSSVWAAVMSTLKRVLANLRESVSTIAITAQGDGCWLIDNKDQPAGNAILWNDGRASALVLGWRQRRLIETVFPISGSVPYPGLLSGILQWLEQNQPERLGTAQYALSCNGWIYRQLTGRAIADLSDASNPFGDVRAGEYSSTLLAEYGLQRYSRLLPQVARGDALIAGLLPDVARALDLKINTRVVMAPYDIVATAYGVGVSEPGQACIILGTTICAETIVSNLNLAGTIAGTTIALDRGLHLRAMPTLTGCETLDWAKRLLGLSEMHELEALASHADRGSNGLVFLPYLSPAGERAPFLEPNAHGSLHGMALSHRREEIARSFYEGLSFGIRECLLVAASDVREIRVCGGGARSDFWCQMISDVTGLEVQRPTHNELGARGAFLFGKVAVGELDSLAATSDRFPLELKKFMPDEKAHQVYSKAYEHFLQVREHARQLWERSQ